MKSPRNLKIVRYFFISFGAIFLAILGLTIFSWSKAEAAEKPAILIAVVLPD